MGGPVRIRAGLLDLGDAVAVLRRVGGARRRLRPREGEEDHHRHHRQHPLRRGAAEAVRGGEPRKPRSDAPVAAERRSPMHRAPVALPAPAPPA